MHQFNEREKWYTIWFSLKVRQFNEERGGGAYQLSEVRLPYLSENGYINKVSFEVHHFSEGASI